MYIIYNDHHIVKKINWTKRNIFFSRTIFQFQKIWLWIHFFSRVTILWQKYYLVTLTIWHNLPVIFSLKKNGLFVGNCIRHIDWSISIGSHGISTPLALEPIQFAASIFQRHDSIEINLQQLTHIYILNPLKNAYNLLLWFDMFSSSHSPSQ